MNDEETVSRSKVNQTGDEHRYVLLKALQVSTENWPEVYYLRNLRIFVILEVVGLVSQLNTYLTHH